MKTATIVLNTLLLGFALVGIIYNGLLPEKDDFEFKVLFLVVPLLNIWLLFEGRPDLRWLSSYLKGKMTGITVYKHDIRYLSMKILAVILNVILIGIIYSIDLPQSAKGFAEFKISMIFTLILSLVMLILSRANKFEGFKRTGILTGVTLFVLLFGFFLSGHIMTKHGIKENISIARQQFPGKAEDALIGYLSDTTKSPQDRTHIAISTLGSIRSEKALPLLKELYKNDPEGITCKGRHDEVICQYALHKAIVAIEGKPFDKGRNWFGSWARLNK